MFILVQTPLLVSVSLLGDTHGERYLSWAIFTALIINGGVTAAQSGVIGRFGSGHLFFTGTTPVYIAVCRTALTYGGPSLLSALVSVSSPFQFLLASWLPLLRRIVTPTVSGTVLILVGAITIPIAFESVADVPEGAPAAGGVAADGATRAVTAALGLRATGRLRLWSPLVGIAAGCVVAGGSHQQSVMTSVYLQVAAELQAAAMRMGEVTYLSDAEIEHCSATFTSEISVNRAWQYLRHRAGVGDL